jgi:glycosyltransferase involved in cell wall biosynthesis
MSDSATAGSPARSADKLRILFVTSDRFPPFRPAAKAIFADGFAETGHDIDWIVQAELPDAPTGEQPFKGGRAYVAPIDVGSSRMARLRKHWQQLRNDFRVFGLLRERRYSLVQVKDKYLGALIAIAAARLHRVPVFYWLAYPHGEASSYAAEHGVARYRWIYALRGVAQRWLLYKVIMPAAAHVFVQSEQMRADIALEGIPLEKMTAVPSSVNLAQIDAALLDRAGSETVAERTIVYLGTLLRERKLDFLVRVLAKVRQRIPDARLVFVGRGDAPADEEMLRREAERLGVADAMTITGWLPMPDAWRMVQRAGVCVSPYFPVPILRSTSPTKLVEYLALGKAVVANDHPEQSEVVAKSGAGVICGWNEDAFSSAIATLLENPQRTAEMGRAGRRFIEQHRTNWAMVNLVLARYRDTLRKEPPDGATDSPAHGGAFSVDKLANKERSL